MMSIYVITNLINGKPYVGITSQTLSRRWSGHKADARKRPKSALHNAIRKYGAENFSIQKIASADTKEEAVAAEKAFIYLAHARVPNGYNLTAGGEGVVDLPKEIRDRITAANIGRKHTEQAKQLIGAASKGHPVSAEVRARISECRKGKPLTADHRKKLSLSKIGKKLPQRSADHCRLISEGLVRAHARRRAAA